MKTFFLLIIATLMSCAHASKDTTLNTAKHVDLNRYMGKWYEIAKIPNSFQKKCAATQANYTLRKDGKVDVLNICKKKYDDGQKEAKGVARVNPDFNSNSILEVSFVPLFGFWFSGDYYIIHVDEDYEYALVGAPSRDYLWILSRSTTLSENTYNYLLNIASKEKFDISRVEKTPEWKK